MITLCCYLQYKSPLTRLAVLSGGSVKISEMDEINPLDGRIAPLYVLKLSIQFFARNPALFIYCVRSSVTLVYLL